MAKLPSALEELEQQLTCPVCLDIYSEPKSLPCLHSFCQHCLECLPVDHQGNKYCIKCPTCRIPIELPEPAGPAAFPVAFHLNNLMEVYSLMKEESSTMNCFKHDDPLRIFCETCQEVICRDCTIFGGHRNHICTPIKDSYQKHRRVLEAHLDVVKKVISDSVNALISLTGKENEVKEQGDAVKNKIHLMANEMIENIRQSERQLTREVDIAVGSKLQVLYGQKESAKMSLSRLKDCKEFVEQCLKTGSQQQVLMSKKQMMERVSHVTKETIDQEYNPIEKADVKFIKNSKMELNIGDIVYTTALEQCKVKHCEITCKREGISFPLSLELPNSSSRLTIPLSSLSCSVVSTDNTPINTAVTATDHRGVYRIHCNTLKRGLHQLNVQVNNVQLESTSLVIPFNPYLARHTSIRITDGLKGPSGVAVSDDGHVIVTERGGNCITVLDREGKKIKSLTSKRNIKFSNPCGVAITPDNFILVTDEHKIQKLTIDGKLIASVGQQGSKPLEFNGPCGVAISPKTGQIYVVDCGNHCIQVLNPDLTFSYSFSSKRSAEGQHSIAINDKGLVYISNMCSHCIQVFTSEGKYKLQFGTRGSGPGQLLLPTGIVINNNLLYVVEWGNHRVSIFTTDGEFVSSFGGYGMGIDHFNIPYDITLDNEGYLYICDLGNNRLVMY